MAASNTLRIAHGRSIVPHRAISHLDHSSSTINDLSRHHIRHTIRPQVIDIISHLGLRGALGPVIEEDLRKRRVHLTGFVASVDESDGDITVVEDTCPEGDLAHAVLVGVVDVKAPVALGGFDLGVLVQGDDGWIRIYGEGGWGHFADVCAHDKGRGIHGPHAEVQLVFVIRHASVADFEHVHVGLGAGLRFRDNGSHFVQDVEDRAVETGQSTFIAFVAGAGAAGVGAGERVVDVAGHAPGVGHGLSPVPGSVCQRY